MSRYIFLSIFLVSLFGCASQRTSNQVVTALKPELSMSEEQRWLLMIGKWYGNQPTKAGGFRQQIIERYADGTYKIVFKITEPNGTVEESVEVGSWGVSGPVYFTMFRGWLYGEDMHPSDPSDPYNYDAYNIVNVTQELFEYEHVSNGNKYKIKKVPNDFVFPQ